MIKLLHFICMCGLYFQEGVVYCVTEMEKNDYLAPRNTSQFLLEAFTSFTRPGIHPTPVQQVTGPNLLDRGWFLDRVAVLDSSNGHDFATHKEYQLHN